MGKGSGRREFNKERERAYKKNHKRVYKPIQSRSAKISQLTKSVYVVKDGMVMMKSISERRGLA